MKYRYRSKSKEKNKGFTLVELIIVVAILAILVGLLAPQYVKYVEKSRKSTDVNNLERLVNAVQIAVSDSDYHIASGLYSIAIMPDYTRVYIKDYGDEASVENMKKLIAALKEYTGYTFTKNNESEYICKDITLKSKRWESSLYGDIYPMIIAYLQVDKNSKITITYDPTDLKDLISTK